MTDRPALPRRGRLLGVTAALLLAAAARGADRIETIEARTIEGTLQAVSEDQVLVRTESQKRTLPRRDVLRIALAEAEDLMTRPGRPVVTLPGGGKLAAENVRVSDGVLEFTTPLLGDVKLKVGDVSVIYLPAENQTPEHIEARCRKYHLTGSKMDMMIVARKDKKTWIGAEGALKGIGPHRVVFRWKDKRHELPRQRVPAVRLARPSGRTPRSAGVLVGKAGGTVGFTSLTADGESFVLGLPTLGRRKIPRDAVAEVRFVSDRVTDLTEIEPAKVTERGFFDTKFPHRVNRSAGGKPIRLGGRTFDRGLGLHSFCELRYDLGGKYVMLVATVGIDDAVRPHGDAGLTFLGDGKPLTDPLRLTGESEPVVVRVGLDGVKKLTLRVDFGEDELGVGDHVDLAAPRLIK